MPNKQNGVASQLTQAFESGFKVETLNITVKDNKLWTCMVKSTKV